MLITLLWPGCRPPPPTQRVVTCCLSLLRIWKQLTLSQDRHEWGISARKWARAALTDVFSIRRVITFSSTPTAASWRYQILARPRGWLGSTPAPRRSQVRSDLMTDWLAPLPVHTDPQKCLRCLSNSWKSPFSWNNKGLSWVVSFVAPFHSWNPLP